MLPHDAAEFGREGPGGIQGDSVQMEGAIDRGGEIVEALTGEGGDLEA